MPAVVGVAVEVARRVGAVGGAVGSGAYAVLRGRPPDERLLDRGRTQRVLPMLVSPDPCLADRAALHAHGRADRDDVGEDAQVRVGSTIMERGSMHAGMSRCWRYSRSMTMPFWRASSMTWSTSPPLPASAESSFQTEEMFVPGPGGEPASSAAS